VTNQSSVSGSRTINFSVAANSGQARTGTITIAGQTFTVSQAAGCSYSLSATNASFQANGGTSSFRITTETGCSWNVISNTSWITVDSGNNGSGNATISFTVQPNSTASRTGTITVNGQTFTVNQANGCTYNLSSTSLNVPAAGGTGSVNVTTTAGCPRIAQSNVSWITITSAANETGNGAVTFSVAANMGSTRSGTITVGGQTFTVNQEIGCAYSLSSSSVSFLASGGNNSFNIVSGTGCAWTAVSNADWITITSGNSGSGNSTVSFSVAVNNGPARTGTITAGGQTFTVRQDTLPVLSINNAVINEGNSGETHFSFTVNLSLASSKTVSVNFATVDGTAVAGEDYSPANGTITFAPGETSKNVTVRVAGDYQVEANETFFINLTGAINAAVESEQGTGMILNDDEGGSLKFSLSNYTVNENEAAATITVLRTDGNASGVSVNYAASNGTAIGSQDYKTVSGTLSFAANETSKTFIVPIINDSINEANETVLLTLSNASGGATLGANSTSILTINDDDPLPTLSINNVSLNEGNSSTTAFNFIVSLSGETSQTVTVKYATENKTAALLCSRRDKQDSISVG
jgi:hypothetical protein